MDDKIIVLMSTYNGQKYIREQLESIINQTYKNLEILIRDDGSADKTVEIISQYTKKYKNIKFYQGENLKPAKSFLDLIKHTEDAKYYAFSDQDDVWDQDKLEVAISFLNKNNERIPKLYFSETRLVDKDLNELHNVKRIITNKINIGNALIENIATGCTCVFNYELKRLLEIIEQDEIKIGYMHDSLAYRICFCTGKIYFDPIPHISYRQHENNVIGNSNNIFDKIKKRKKSITKTLNLRSNMAKYIYEKFNDEIIDENKSVIKCVAYYKKSLINKIELFLNYKITRMSFLDDLFYRIAIILGKV